MLHVKYQLGPCPVHIYSIVVRRATEMSVRIFQKEFLARKLLPSRPQYGRTITQGFAIHLQNIAASEN
jgi:hypothetical protein